MNTTPNDGPGNDWAKTEQQPQIPPEIETRIREAVTFLRGVIFDAQAEMEGRVAALETLDKKLALQSEYVTALWADYDERKQAEQRAIDEAEWAAAHFDGPGENAPTGTNEELVPEIKTLEDLEYAIQAYEGSRYPRLLEDVLYGDAKEAHQQAATQLARLAKAGEKDRGFTRQQAEELLAKYGWSFDAVKAALANPAGKLFPAQQ